VRRRSPPPFPFPEGSDPFSLFQISLENFFDIKFRMWKEHGLDPNWIETIPFYEYQIWIDKLNLYIEKENKQTMEDSGQVEVFNFKK
jgi:hypothetical protein